MSKIHKIRTWPCRHADRHCDEWECRCPPPWVIETTKSRLRGQLRMRLRQLWLWLRRKMR